LIIINFCQFYSAYLSFRNIFKLLKMQTSETIQKGTGLTVEALKEVEGYVKDQVTSAVDVIKRAIDNMDEKYRNDLNRMTDTQKDEKETTTTTTTTMEPAQLFRSETLVTIQTSSQIIEAALENLNSRITTEEELYLFQKIQEEILAMKQIMTQFSESFFYSSF